MKYKKLFALAIAGVFFLSGCDSASTNSEISAVVPEVVVPELVQINAADTIFVNAKVVTVDEDFSIAEAIAIKDDRIMAVGSTANVSQLANSSTEVIDLEGKTVIPGLIDNHIHFIRAGQRWNLQARIDGINSRQEALDTIAEKAASMEPGEWLMVQGGWWPNQFADQPGDFTLEELDAVAPNNPLFLQLVYFTVYSNTLALEAVNVDPAEGAKHGGPVLISPQPPYGLLNEQMPEVSRDQIKQNVQDVIARFNRAGLTSVYDVGRPPEGDITLLEDILEEDGFNLLEWINTAKTLSNPAVIKSSFSRLNVSAPQPVGKLVVVCAGEHV